jgi:hypothetical protein
MLLATGVVVVSAASGAGSTVLAAVTAALFMLRSGAGLAVTVGLTAAKVLLSALLLAARLVATTSL